MTAERVLAVFAHPDDESLLAGGTLAALTAAGVDVMLVCATAGEQGPIASPQLATRANLGVVRRAELGASARVLGVRTVECLGHPDGELKWADPAAVAADLKRVLRRWRPSVVITFGPEGLYWHPDHVAVHEFTLAALDLLAREGYSPWVYYATWPQGIVARLVTAMRARGLPADLWGLHPETFGVPQASITTVRDVRPLLATKLRALRCHRSQLAPDHLLASIPDDLAEEFLGREYFVRARPRAAARDWLEDALGKKRSPRVRYTG